MQINPKNLILSSDTFGILSCSCTSIYLNDPNLSSLVHYSNTARNKFNFFLQNIWLMEFCAINENLGITSRFERKLSVIILLTVQFLILAPVFDI